MRTRVLLLVAALFAAVRPGAAQNPPQAPPAPPKAPPAPQAAAAPEGPFTGTLDVGGLFTAVDGDEARYERYRDTRDGVYSTFTLNRTGEAYVFDADAFHVGYRDQRYAATFFGRKVDVAFDWVSVPLNFSYMTLTPFTISGGTLTLPDSAQSAVQSRAAVGVPCAPGAPPASCSNPSLAAQAKVNRSIYNDLASPFDLRYGRDMSAVAVRYAASRDVDVDVRFASNGREGTQPWSTSFAFNNVVEVPQPLNQRTNDLSLGASWADTRSMFRLGWTGSWFNNSIHSLTVDNPIRLTDFSNGLTPPNGPYDPSGYSNGNGPAQGHQAMAPDNMMSVISATGMRKLPGRTTLNGVLQLTHQRQDDELIPWTTNSVINQPIVFAAFPNLTQIPRPTAEAEAMGVNALVSVSARPTRVTNVHVRYRFNQRDVQTTPFDATQYVRFDAAPSTTEEGITHQFDTNRHFFDANVSLTPATWGTVRLGFGHEAVERHGRGFAQTGENILRVSFDTYTSAFYTVRAAYDVSRRRGDGFVEAHTWLESEDLETITGPGGTQPTLRYYDEADRDRSRGSVILTVFPRDTYDVFFQFAGGRDRYLRDPSAPVSRPGEQFGLLEQDVVSWNVGANYHPTEMVAVGANYGRDRYSSFQRSRNANPPPDPTWTDPSRDWTLDNDDHINTFGAYVDLLKPFRNTDVRFGYDYNDSNNSFVHGGPRVATLASINQFIPLPDVDNRWQRATADVQYYFTERAGIGVGYYFEKLDIEDWNTIDTDGPVGFAPETGEPRIDWLGGLITGYGNRPYTGHTAFVRVLYRF